MPGRAWATALMLVAIGSAGPVAAQPSAGLPPAADPRDQLPPAASGAIPDHPPPILGSPLVISNKPAPSNIAPIRANVAPFPPTPSTTLTTAETYFDPPRTQPPVRAARLGAPFASSEPIAAPADVEPLAETPAETRLKQIGAATSPPDRINDFPTSRWNFTAKKDDDRGSKSHWQLGENLSGIVGNCGEPFRSDHAFDGFISPVTNPFLFEDPRSLTELRPIFMVQQMPHNQADFRGGNISFFGVQGRIAFTDRLSFVINKLGGIWVEPGSASPLDSQSGVAELWFGPKYTFIRNEQTGTLVAGGLQFQAPIGSPNAYQSNGSLSLVPYVSAAQNLFRDFAAGGFNVMGTTGYSASTTAARSDYWYLSGHIDMDVLNWHHFYPLFEMNYFVTTTNGNSTYIGSEGRDLINFGGQAAGKGLLTGAFGARYKITENAQFGGAFEMPWAGPRDLFLYRFTLDFILRY